MTTFPRRFVAPLLVGSALNPVNSALIAVALVPIAEAMRVPPGRTAVLVAALYLASAVAQPTAGKLADEFGPRRVFLAGILLVLAGGALGGFAQDLPTLVAARALVGVGTSAGYPTAMLLIRRRASAAGLTEPPGGVLGALSIAGQVTAAVGPPLGGLLVGAAGWRATFLVNIPAGLAALAMVLSWVPKDPPLARGTGAVSRVDPIGIAGFAGALTALLVFLMSLPDPDWIALGIAVVLGTALVRWELRAANPFFDVRLLRSNAPLSRTYARNGLTLLGSYTVLFGLTQWFEAGRGLTAGQAGLLVLPMSGLAAIVSIPVSRRGSIRGPLIVAAVSSLLASTGLLFLDSGTAIAAIAGVALLFGIALGTSAVSNQAALYAQAPASGVGTASGLFRTFTYLGTIASATITGIVFRTGVTDGKLHTIAVVLILISAVVALMTVTDHALKELA